MRDIYSCHSPGVTDWQKWPERLAVAHASLDEPFLSTRSPAPFARKQRRMCFSPLAVSPYRLDHSHTPSPIHRKCRVRIPTTFRCRLPNIKGLVESVVAVPVPSVNTGLIGRNGNQVHSDGDAWSVDWRMSYFHMSPVTDLTSYVVSDQTRHVRSCRSLGVTVSVVSPFQRRLRNRLKLAALSDTRHLM